MGLRIRHYRDHNSNIMISWLHRQEIRSMNNSYLMLSVQNRKLDWTRCSSHSKGKRSKPIGKLYIKHYTVHM